MHPPIKRARLIGGRLKIPPYYKDSNGVFSLLGSIGYLFNSKINWNILGLTEYTYNIRQRGKVVPMD